MGYNFTITLRPYGDSATLGVVEIDPVALYGYWEHRDGSEGGGLWFDRRVFAKVGHHGAGTLMLTDYDGAFSLPAKVVSALREAGAVVGDEFN